MSFKYADITPEIVSKVFKKLTVDLETGCWLFGNFDKQSYGIIKLNGHCIKTHRIVYMIYNGDIEEGNLIHHTCEDAACNSPAHL